VSKLLTRLGIILIEAKGSSNRVRLESMPGYFHRRVTSPFLNLVRQGVTPNKLALSLALGICISCFPVMGVTTFLCTIVALAFGLNVPAIIFGNYLAFPLQFMLLIPFIRLGARLFRDTRPLPSVEQMTVMIKNNPEKLVKEFWALQWHAIVGWAMVAPLVCLLLTLVFREVLRRVNLRRPNSGQRTVILPGAARESLPSDVSG
jgi:uncharacterized protein (DUF2062 family)